MQRTLWQTGLHQIIIMNFTLGICLAIVIFGIVKRISMIILFGAVLLILTTLSLITSKDLYGKVTFSKENITITHFNKIKKIIKWEDISYIFYNYNRSTSIPMAIVFKKYDEEETRVIISGKLYRTIIEFCPRQDLIDMVNRIPELKIHHDDEETNNENE